MTHPDDERIVREWLSKESGYVGDTDDLGSVCLDGWFDLNELLTTLRTDHEREKLDILIAVNEWLIARGDMSAAKELNDAMLTRFQLTPTPPTEEITSDKE